MTSTDLVRLVNRAVSPGIKFKQSNMPFVQMENISHFLKACEMPPLNLPAHDRFLTVDLYDNKDPAQVLQCIAAFSRRANVVNPSAFPNTLGAKSKGSSMSPQGTGSSQGAYGSKSPQYTTNVPKVETSPATAFNPLNRAAYSGRISPTKASSLSRGGLATGGPTSSWSSKDDEGKTTPAWNIHQYGYMGGASQGNQGVAFGSRRQITSSQPQVPSLAEKEKRLREKLEKEQQELQENEQRLRQEQEAEEVRAREEEERRWAEETRRLREQEQLEQRRAEEEERRLRQQQAMLKMQEEEARKKEEALRLEEQALKEQAVEAQMAAERARQRTTSDARLNGQFLSQYRASEAAGAPIPQSSPQSNSAESRRIAELERQLAELKQQSTNRERRDQQQQPPPRAEPEYKPSLPSRNPAPQAASTVDTSHEDDWDASERDYLKKAWHEQQAITAEHGNSGPPKPPRPQAAEPTRPLPDPTAYQPGTNRTDRYLSSNPAPAAAQTRTSRPEDFSTTSEVDAENARRAASQQKTKAGGWASKSLLEREMERERERQREWEDAQKDTQNRARDMQEGAGPGQTWDVNQYGYMGGDNQNRGGPGLGVGGARRQILGPRPPP